MKYVLTHWSVVLINGTNVQEIPQVLWISNLRYSNEIYTDEKCLSCILVDVKLCHTTT